MKTILYQPLFINPQAYFVFPQLYHIEKGDSYIEPANIKGHTMQNYVFDEVEQTWKPNTPKAYVCPEYDFHIIAMGEQMKIIKNWSPLASISTFSFKATDNQIQFAGSTDGGTMKYILDDTDVTKFTIEYTNTAGEGNVYLSTAIVFSSSTALLMLFIKENSDRCHYYNGKWNKKDLAIGISSIILGSIAKYFITLI